MCGLSRRELAGLVALFVLTLPAVTPRLYSSDEVQYFSYLRSLWFDRDVSFDNEYRHLYERGIARTPGFEQTFLQDSTPTGQRVNFATIGCAILWAPFYAAADLVTRIARASGRDVAADGYSQPYIAAVAYASTFYGCLAVLLSMRAARQVTGFGIGAGLAVWLGTPLLFYMYAAPPYSHACSAFAAALFVTVWLHVRNTWSIRGLMALAASAALMGMVREQDLFLAIGPLADFGLDLFKRARAARNGSDVVRALGRVPLAAIAALAAFLTVFTPQLMAYQAVNGHFGPSRLVSRKMTWTAPHALQVLFSPEHGLLIWTPLAALAVAGLAVLASGRIRWSAGAARIGGCALLMVAAQVYISGSVESWTVAGAFGQRRFVALTALFVLGMGALGRVIADATRPARYGLAVLIALCIWWNLGMMVLFGADLMDRQRLEPARNAYDVFVTVPRLAPQIAYRYFMDRQSFYKPPAIQ